MKFDFKQVYKEFDDENYEGILDILGDEEYSGNYRILAIFFRIVSLMGLKRYDDALKVIDEAIEIDPYYGFFWSQKVKAYYFLDEKDKALRTLDELERVVDRNDKKDLFDISKLFNIFKQYEKAIKYCNMALEIDKSYPEAIALKIQILYSIGDSDALCDYADELLKNYDGYKQIVPLFMKLSAGRYDDCLDIVNNSDDFDEEQVELFKAAIYQSMVDDLDIQIGISEPLEISIDDALKILFDYYYGGIRSAQFKGVLYAVVDK